jgi:DNA-binding NtrC family response regulator
MHALIVDDEPSVRSFVGTVLRADGWEVGEAESAESAFELLDERDWKLICCDVVMSGIDGFGALGRFREQIPDARVVLMTGHGTAAGALNAAARGAYDYLLKPINVEELQSLSQEVRESFTRNSTANLLKPIFFNRNSEENQIIGNSPTLIEAMKQVGRVAGTNLPVLITGESGTGKEVVARAVHKQSQRTAKPFIAVNCGAIPAELIESELFGHVRGSFTGADRDRAGLFEEADGGTVFLDEITETNPAFQVKLLRVLQEGEIRRVGSNKTTRINVRVIAASNRNVEAEVEDGRFRQDLFYRLNAFTINLPPLRERSDDIVQLIYHFAKTYWTGKTPIVFTQESIELLKRYDWPGNIRELENTVMRATSLCRTRVRPDDLPERIRKFHRKAEATNSIEFQNASNKNLDLIDSSASREEEDWPTLAQMESRYVEQVLRHTNGNKQQSARILQIDRKTLDRMIRRYGLSV